MLDEFGDPLHLMIPRSKILVRISVRANRYLDQPDIGIRLRNHLGLDFAATSAMREGHPPGPMKAGESVTADFHFDIPELYPGAFSFSPWICGAGGSACPNRLRLHRQRHHRTNGTGDGPVYGYIQVPCRIEVKSEPSRCLNSPENVSFPDLVDADLLNEHLARYRFAKHFADRLNHRPSNSGRGLRIGLRHG